MTCLEPLIWGETAATVVIRERMSLSCLVRTLVEDLRFLEVRVEEFWHRLG